MLEFFKKHRTKILIILAAVAVLTAAFFMGGNPNDSIQVETNTSSVNSLFSEISENETTNTSNISDTSVLSSKENSTVSTQSKPKETSDVSKNNVSKNNSESSKNNTSNTVSVDDSQSTVPEEHSTDNSQSTNENSTQNSTDNSSLSSNSIKNSSATSDSQSKPNPDKNENISNNSSDLNSSKPNTLYVINENSIALPSQSQTEKNTCTISISCATILNNMDKLKSSKKSLVPSDGWILKETTVTFNDGDTVFDVLKQTCTDRKIHLEFSKTPLYNSMYIEGINNLYEFDCGSQSGWMYRVNGTYNSYSCSEIKVKNGDKIQWLYTCDLGKDIGGYFAG